MSEYTLNTSDIQKALTKIGVDYGIDCEDERSESLRALIEAFRLGQKNPAVEIYMD